MTFWNTKYRNNSVIQFGNTIYIYIYTYRYIYRYIDRQIDIHIYRYIDIDYIDRQIYRQIDRDRELDRYSVYKYSLYINIINRKLVYLSAKGAKNI